MALMNMALTGVFHIQQKSSGQRSLRVLITTKKKKKTPTY